MHEIRAICPKCGSLTQSGRVDPKFYFNSETKLGFCHHCEFKGKFETEEFVDTLNVVSIKDKVPFDPKSFEKLEPLTKEALAYLNKRFPGATQSQLDEFSLRYSKNHHAIAIPSFNDVNKLQGIKFRYIAPIGKQRYDAEEGSQFGGYWLAGRADKLLIVEGEFDAMAAKLAGFEGTVLALQTNRLSQYSIDRVRKFKNIFIYPDSDEAGTEGSVSIQNQYQNSVLIKGPQDKKDLNEFFQSNPIKCSKFLLENTKTELEKATVNLSSSSFELIEFLSNERNTCGDSTGYPAINSLLGGGLRPSEMTVVNSFAKVGKSSFINNLTYNLSCLGKKIGIASFEMDPARTLYPSLLSIAGQTNIRAIRDKALLEESVELLQKDCSYLNNIIAFKKFGYTPWSVIEEWAVLMKEQHQIEYLVLDHAGFMVEKMTDADQNQTLAKNIAELTRRLELHTFVVVQSPKTKDGFSIQTAYGGMAWAQNCDNFIILERAKDDDLKLQVRLEASRYPGSNPSSTPVFLYYDRETCSLKE